MKYFNIAFALLLLAIVLNSIPVPPEPTPVVDCRPTLHLPTLCAGFYNDGTGRWAKCMGVEKK